LILAASPNLTGVVLSGSGVASRALSFSATTLSGGTLYSGSTDLYSIFSPIGAGGGISAIQSVGLGNSIYKQLAGSTAEFRSISAGTNVTIVTGDTITIHAAAGSVVISQGTVNFGSITNKEYQTAVTISDVSILATSRILVSLANEATDEHSLDEILIEDVRLAAGYITAGTGFQVVAYAPLGTYGQFKFNYTIAY
jgi:hypothetical protein